MLAILALMRDPFRSLQVSCLECHRRRSDPGGDLAANYVVTNAIAFPSLGRDLSSGNVTVNLVPPGTFYGERENNMDLRIAKVVRIGSTRAQFGVDVYNLLNTDVVTTYNEGYVAPTATRGSIWLTPNTILPGTTRGSISRSTSETRTVSVEQSNV